MVVRIQKCGMVDKNPKTGRLGTWTDTINLRTINSNNIKLTPAINKDRHQIDSDNGQIRIIDKTTYTYEIV